MTHDASHEKALERALTGEPPDLNSALQRELEGCPECRSRLAELRQLEKRLAQDAALERLEIEEARAGATQEDEDGLRNALAQGRRAQAGRRPPWRLGLLLLSLAAGLALVQLLSGPRPEDVRPPSPEVLLGGDFELRVVVREGRYDGFEWERELLPGESFELSFLALEEGAVGSVLATHAGLETTRYAPTETEERSLPGALHVTVTVRGVDGAARARAWLSASRH